MSDRERTIAAALEAAIAGAMTVGGLLLLLVWGLAGIVLLTFGVAGLDHAIALALGLMSFPERDEDDGEQGR
jgi:hypothetical protein